MGVLRPIFLANQIAEFLKVQCHMNEMNLFFCLRIDIKICTSPIRFCYMMKDPFMKVFLGNTYLEFRNVFQTLSNVGLFQTWHYFPKIVNGF